MKCPNCDRPVPDDALVCPNCGVLVASFATSTLVSAPRTTARRRRLWLLIGVAVGGFLLVGALAFFLWPRRPTLQLIALEPLGAAPEAAAGLPAFYPDSTLQLHFRWRLPPGQGLLVRWYHTGCMGEEISSEQRLEGRRKFAFPWIWRTTLSLPASPNAPLAIGDYRVEILPEGDTESKLAQRLAFRIVAPPGAIPSQVGELGLAWLVDSEGQPLRRTNTFMPYEVVYLAARGDLGLYSTLEAYWYFPGDEVVDRTTLLTTTRNLRDRPLLTFLAEPVPLVPGDYRVAVCLDGQLQQELEFQVQEWVNRLGVLSEDFEQPGDWSVGSSDTVDRGYEDGRYRIEVLGSEMIAWSRLRGSFSDVAIQVVAEQTAGPFDSDYGVICRYLDGDNFYSFSLSGVGEYSIYKLVSDEWVALVPWTPAQAIWSALPNRITVLCQEHELSLRVNGVLLGRVQDEAFEEGDVGLFAGTRSDGGVRILFDDLQVVPLK